MSKRTATIGLIVFASKLSILKNIAHDINRNKVMHDIRKIINDVLMRDKYEFN